MKKIRWIGHGRRQMNGYEWPAHSACLVVSDEDALFFTTYPRPGQFEDMGIVDDAPITEMSGLSEISIRTFIEAGVSTVAQLAGLTGSGRTWVYENHIMSNAKVAEFQAEAKRLLGEPRPASKKRVSKKSSSKKKSI